MIIIALFIKEQISLARAGKETGLYDVKVKFMGSLKNAPQTVVLNCAW